MVDLVGALMRQCQTWTSFSGMRLMTWNFELTVNRLYLSRNKTWENFREKWRASLCAAKTPAQFASTVSVLFSHLPRSNDCMRSTTNAFTHVCAPIVTTMFYNVLSLRLLFRRDRALLFPRGGFCFFRPLLLLEERAFVAPLPRSPPTFVATPHSRRERAGAPPLGFFRAPRVLSSSRRSRARLRARAAPLLAPSRRRRRVETPSSL